MLQAYPVDLTKDEEGYIVQFPNVPEALTVGSDIDNALMWAQDALVVALSGYMDDKKDIPKPSKPVKGQLTVALPPMAASKLAIYQAMRNNNVSQAELAEKLNCDARQVRRLLDLDHNSTLDQLASALRALNKQLIIDITERKPEKLTGRLREAYAR
jgi:antitoxin HicB